MTIFNWFIFCWLHFIIFGFLKKYAGIIFVGMKMHFSILFGFFLEHEKQVKKAKILLFLFLAFHLIADLKMLLNFF